MKKREKGGKGMGYEIKAWEEVTLSDNYMFNKVMTSSPDICRRFIEHLLHIEIERVETPRGEVSFEADAESRGIRLDVYVRESGGEMRVFDLEMQVVNTHSLAERARYYQGVMDESELSPSEDYRKLRTSYIMFLCLFDPFGKGLPVYTFRNRCEEDKDVELGDRTHKVFYNIKGYGKLEDEEEKAIFRLILDGAERSEFTREIRERVEYARKNVQWRQGYMTLARLKREEHEEGFKQGLSQGLQKGLLQGERKKAVATAIVLKQSGIDIALISKSTGLSEKEIESL